ncbi:TonB-dependent receptor [Sphingobium sp.]|uniref:TonB-dependent receptor domain-containing protein n=1 Tax=Sphingobium sp. TaxID=1912891 RepID=UPI00262D7D3C|nr:TonB-dependent receptor [Sphingobium sp.]
MRMSQPGIGLVSMIALAATICPANAQEQRLHFDVKAQPANRGLVAFAKQANVQILATGDQVADKQVSPVKGEYTVPDGLRRLTEGTGLTIRQTGARTFMVIPATTRAAIRPTAMAQAPAAPRRSASPPPALPVAAQDENENFAQEIVVTAQKREQNIQDVPLSVQVVGEAQLGANNVVDFNDLNRVAPSMVVRTAETPANANISIRGIGTLAFSPGVEPSVAVILDDVPLAFQARAFTDLNDVERIEVLRGPQTTLYGKSASAGLINIVTKGPSDSFTATLRGMATTDDEQQVGLTVSGPLTDTLGYRTSVSFDDFAGNARNLADGKTVNGRRYFSAHQKVRWKPTDDLQVDLGVDYQDGRSTTVRPFIRLSPNAILRGNRAFTPNVFAPGITVGSKNSDVYTNFPSGNEYRDFAQSLRVSYDTGGPTLMSITAHDRYTSSDRLDNDDSAIPNFDNRQTGDFKTEQFSQELRLVSPGNDRLRYTLGLFFNSTTFERTFTRGPIFSIARWAAANGSDQIASFGQLEYDVIPSTTLIAGARYSRERIDYRFNDLVANRQYGGDAVDYFGTYRLGIQHQFARDVTSFLTYATGYKGQAYDISTGFNQARADGGPVRPEKSNSWELGVRSQFFDRRATLNVTLFNSRFRDFQAQAVDILPDGTQNFRLTNVGRVRTRGVEVETAFRPFSNLSIGVAGTYLDAKNISFIGAPCFPLQTVAQGCSGSPTRQDLSGTRSGQAPKWKIAGNYEYWHSLGDTGIDAVTSGAVTYQSSLYSRDPLAVNPAYTIVNIQLGVRDHRRKWQVMGFVNNLFDKQYRYLYNNVSGSYGATALQGYLPRDFRRYGGIRLSYTY